MRYNHNMRSFDTVIQFLASSKTITAVLFLMLLTGGIFTATLLTGQTQDIRQRADTNITAPNSCQDCKALNLDNAYFCRNSEGQTDCQPKDISEAIPGSVCIDCSMIDESAGNSKKNPVQVWWETLLDAVNPDLNHDGKIDGSDAMLIFSDFKPEEN